MTLPILPLLIGGAAYGRARQMKSQQAEKEQQAMTALARQLRSAGLYEDPAAQAAVGQMMNPALREVGTESALAMLAPGAAQQREMSALQLENQRQANAGQRVAQQQAAGRYGMDAEAYQYGVSQRPAEERRSALQERLLGAQLDMATAQGDSARTADKLGAIRFMSDKYQTNMKAPVEVADAVQQIDGSLKVGNSLGGLAAVIKLAKILDPTSVVREGEVTTVEGGIGTAQSLISTFNRLFNKGWSPEAAKQFDAVVKQVAGPILQRGLRLNQEYATLAGQFEVNPEVVVTGVGFPTGYVTRWLTGVPDPEVETTY